MSIRQPVDLALPTSRENSRPVAPVRQSEPCVPFVGSVSSASVDGSTVLRPTSNHARFHDLSQSRPLRQVLSRQRRPESLFFRTGILLLDQTSTRRRNFVGLLRLETRPTLPCCSPCLPFLPIASPQAFDLPVTQLQYGCCIHQLSLPL